MCDLKFSELDRSEAAQGGRSVFSVQLPPLLAEDESEVRTGRKLIDASKAAGVEIFAHTSVLDSRMGQSHPAGCDSPGISLHLTRW